MDRSFQCGLQIVLACCFGSWRITLYMHNTATLESELSYLVVGTKHWKSQKFWKIVFVCLFWDVLPIMDEGQSQNFEGPSLVLLGYYWLHHRNQSAGDNRVFEVWSILLVCCSLQDSLITLKLHHKLPLVTNGYKLVSSQLVHDNGDFEVWGVFEMFYSLVYTR